MSRPHDPPAVALRNSRRLQVGAALLAGVALFAVLAGGWRLAVAAIVVAIILNIVAIEGLRVVVASLPERRR